MSSATFTQKLPPCHKCSKTTFPMEKIEVNDLVFHESCFVCQECNIKLSNTTYSSFEGSFYCMRDYYAVLRKLKAPSESSATSVQDSARTPIDIPGRNSSSQKSVCDLCQKRVFKVAGMSIEIDDKMMHKACFICCECKELLSTDNYNTYEGSLYCPLHYYRVTQSNGLRKPGRRSSFSQLPANTSKKKTESKLSQTTSPEKDSTPDTILNGNTTNEPEGEILPENNKQESTEIPPQTQEIPQVDAAEEDKNTCKISEDITPETMQEDVVLADCEQPAALSTEETKDAGVDSEQPASTVKDIVSSDPDVNHSTSLEQISGPEKQPQNASDVPNEPKQLEETVNTPVESQAPISEPKSHEMESVENDDPPEEDTILNNESVPVVEDTQELHRDERNGCSDALQDVVEDKETKKTENSESVEISGESSHNEPSTENKEKETISTENKEKEPLVQDESKESKQPATIDKDLPEPLPTPVAIDNTPQPPTEVSLEETAVSPSNTQEPPPDSREKQDEIPIEKKNEEPESKNNEEPDKTNEEESKNNENELSQEENDKNLATEDSNASNAPSEASTNKSKERDPESPTVRKNTKLKKSRTSSIRSKDGKRSRKRTASEKTESGLRDDKSEDISKKKKKGRKRVDSTSAGKDKTRKRKSKEVEETSEDKVRRRQERRERRKREKRESTTHRRSSKKKEKNEGQAKSETSETSGKPEISLELVEPPKETPIEPLESPTASSGKSKSRKGIMKRFPRKRSVNMKDPPTPSTSAQTHKLEKHSTLTSFVSGRLRKSKKDLSRMLHPHATTGNLYETQQKTDENNNSKIPLSSSDDKLRPISEEDSESTEENRAVAPAKARLSIEKTEESSEANSVSLEQEKSLAQALPVDLLSPLFIPPVTSINSCHDLEELDPPICDLDIPDGAPSLKISREETIEAIPPIVIDFDSVIPKPEDEFEKIKLQGILRPPCIRAGIVGLDRRLFQLLCEIQRSYPHQLEISVATSLSPEAFAIVKEQFGQDIKVVSDIEDLLAEKEIQWVFVNVSTDKTSQVIQQILTSGKNVFCEKPVVQNLFECIAIQDCLNKAPQQHLLSGFVWRHVPFYQEVYNIISQRSIGDILSIEANHLLDPGTAGLVMSDWTRFSSLSHSLVMNSFIYDIDLLCWLLDSLPSEVVSFGGRNLFVCSRQPEAEEELLPYKQWPHMPMHSNISASPFSTDRTIDDNHFVLLNFNDDTRVSLNLNTHSSFPQRRLLICGSLGTLEGDLYTGQIRYKFVGDNEFGTIQVTPGNAHGGSDNRLVEGLMLCALQGDTQFCYSGPQLFPSVATALAIMKSKETKQVVNMKNYWQELQLDNT